LSQRIVHLRNIEDFASMIECASGVGDVLAHILTSNDTILFDIDAPSDCSPAFLSVTNCLAARLRTQNVPFDTRNLPDWMIIMDDIDTGLTGVHGPRIIQAFSNAPSGKSMLARFKCANSELISQFVREFSPLLVGLPNLYEEMESALAELMDNVFAHSESPEGGFLVGRHYTNLSILRFAVCDLGISIPRHLRRMAPEYLNQTDENVLAEAFVLGVSGNKETRFGSGLPTVSDMTIRLGGQLNAFSGSAIYKVQSGIANSVNVEKRFPGTLVSIEWPTSGG
jgi:hypothetical protein